jgi:hypothetical protein
MDCRAARDWLLQAERPEAWAADPAAPADHIQSCPRCRNLALELERLESDYRDQPLPAGCESAREAFIARLPISLPGNRPRRWFSRRRWAVAAAALLLVCSGAYLWWPEPSTPEPETAPDVVERLVDWNLALARSDDEAERRQVLDEEAPRLRTAVAEADLPDDDRELAESLLESGEFIAAQTDPMDQADRFDDLADKLVAQIDSATNKRDARRLKKLANCYRRIAELGIHANLDRLEEEKLDPKRAKKLERILRREAARIDKLKRLLEWAPRASRKELRRAITPPTKPHRGKKHRKR